MTTRKERHHFVTGEVGGPAGRGGLAAGCSRVGAGGGGHEGAEDGVHAGLVAGALGAEPGDDVGIEAQSRHDLRVTGIAFRSQTA